MNFRNRIHLEPMNLYNKSIIKYLLTHGHSMVLITAGAKYYPTNGKLIDNSRSGSAHNCGPPNPGDRRAP